MPELAIFSLHPQIPGHQSVFINEPRLSDFKQVLLKEGIQAEFVGGVLVCNNMVAVRRVSVPLVGVGAPKELVSTRAKQPGRQNKIRLFIFKLLPFFVLFCFGTVQTVCFCYSIVTHK